MPNKCKFFISLYQCCSGITSKVVRKCERINIRVCFVCCGCNEVTVIQERSGWESSIILWREYCRRTAGNSCTPHIRKQQHTYTFQYCTHKQTFFPPSSTSLSHFNLFVSTSPREIHAVPLQWMENTHIGCFLKPFFFFNYMVNLCMFHTIMRINAKKAKLLLIPLRHIQE